MDEDFEDVVFEEEEEDEDFLSDNDTFTLSDGEEEEEEEEAGEEWTGEMKSCDETNPNEMEGLSLENLAEMLQEMSSRLQGVVEELGMGGKKEENSNYPRRRRRKGKQKIINSFRKLRPLDLTSLHQKTYLDRPQTNREKRSAKKEEVCGSATTRSRVKETSFDPIIHSKVVEKLLPDIIPSEEEIISDLPPNRKLELLEKKIDSCQTPENRVSCAVEYLAAVRMTFGSESVQEARGLLLLGEVYFSCGMTSQAIDHCRTALRLCRQLSPTNRQAELLMPVVLTTTGMVHLSMKKFDVSITLLRRAVNENVRLKGEVDISHVPVYVALCKALTEKGGVGEAGVALEKAWNVLELSGELFSDKTVTVLLERGKWFASQKKKLEAIQSFERAAEIIQRREGMNSVSFGETKLRVAKIYSDNSQHSESVGCYEKGYEALVSYYGYDNQRVVEVGKELSFQYVSCGKYEEAKNVLRNVVTSERKLGGSGSISLADGMKLLGSVHFALGDTESAIYAFGIAVKTYRKHYGGNDEKVKMLEDTIRQLRMGSDVVEEDDDSLSDS